MTKIKTFILSLVLLVILVTLNIFFVSKYVVSYYGHLICFQLIIAIFVIAGIHLNKKDDSDIKTNKHLYFSAILFTLLQVGYFASVKNQVFDSLTRFIFPIIYFILFLFIFPKNVTKLKKDWMILSQNIRILNVVLLILNTPFYFASIIVFYYLLRNFN